MRFVQTQNSPQKSPRLVDFAVCACILALAVISFRGVWAFWFTDVDVFSLIQTGRFATWSDVKKILTSELMLGRMPNAVYYRPLLSLLYGLEWKAFGLTPAGYHYIDVLLHGLNAVWVYVLWRLLFPEQRRSFGALAAVFFLWHPFQVENVPAIARLGDLAATFCIAAALAAFVRHLQSGAALWWGLAFVAAVLAIGTKEPAIIIVPLLTAAAFFSAGAKAAVKKTWPLWVLAVVFLIVRRAAIHGVGGYEPTSERSVLAEFFFRFQFNAMGHSVGLALAGFSGEIVQRVMMTLKRTPLLWIVTWITLVGGSAAYLWRRRREPVVLLLVVFIVLQAMMIHLSFFMFRYLYLSLIPIGLLLASELARGVEKRGTALFGAALAAFVIAPAFWAGPALNFSGYERWRESGEIMQRFCVGLDENLAQHGAAENIFITGIPYKRLYRSQAYFFWDMPQTQILLEHAVQDYVTLQHPDRPLHIVGLGYMYLWDDLKNYRGDAYRGANAEDILLSVPTGAEWIDYPWVKRPGRVSSKELFSFVKLNDEKTAQIFLTARALALPNPLFLHFGSGGAMGEMKPLLTGTVD